MLGIIAMNILSTKEKFVYPSSVLLMMLFGMKKVRMWTKTPRARARLAAIKKMFPSQSVSVCQPYVGQRRSR